MKHDSESLLAASSAIRENANRLEEVAEVRDAVNPMSSVVETVWIGQRAQVPGDANWAQPVVGKNDAGDFHPGMCLRTESGARVAWGAGFPSKQTALNLAQSSGRLWLHERSKALQTVPQAAERVQRPHRPKL